MRYENESLPKAYISFPTSHHKMKSSTLDAILLRYLGYALLFLGSAYFLYLVRGALPVFFLAGLMAYALDPVLRILERRGYSRVGAVCFMFLVFLLLFLLLITLVISAFQQAQELQGNLKPYLDSLSHLQEHAHKFVARLPIPETVKTGAQTWVDQGFSRFTAWIGNSAVATASSIIGSLGAIMIYTVVLPIVTFWFMMEMDTIRKRTYVIIPSDNREDVAEIVNSINDLLGSYVRGQMLICGLFGLLCTIAFSILGVAYGMQYGIVLGLVAGVIYIVPYIGMLTVAAAAGLTAYLTSSQPTLCAVLAVGCCVVFNLIIDYVVSPRVLGRGVGLHPVLVIFALLAGAEIGGIFGMILAVPIIASLRVILIYMFPQLVAPLPENKGIPPTTEKAEEIAPKVTDNVPEFL